MKKYFLLKNISLKHSGVRSYFEIFIETNTIVQSNLDFDAQFWNYDLFILKTMCIYAFFSSLFVPHVHMHASTDGTAAQLVLIHGGS